jgi:arabinofuranan 3-O-arabinosyltransferase
MGLVALALGYRTWHVAISHSQMGIDFRPLWEAATALEHGRSIYADRAFVYLPTTAVLCLPFTLLSYHAALNLELLLETVAVAVATALAVLPLRREWRFIAIAAAVAFVFKAELTRDTVFFGNASLLVAPLAVFALLSFEREEWFWGCGALALSLLIKPLLPVLIIVPLLRGRWRELAWTLGPAALAVVVLAVALPADGRILHLPSYLLNGSNLEGSHVAANVSLQGVGKRLGAVGPFFIARIVMVVLTLAALLHWMRGPRRSGDTGAIGTALVLTTMFAGSLAESHYLLL